MEIRTVEELEKLKGKTYRQLTLMHHLPNFRRINPNAKEQTRTMAKYMYCVLYEQITGLRASQTGCVTDFKAPTMPFKRLITGKRQKQEEDPAEAWKMSPKWKVQHRPKEQGRQPNQQQQQKRHPEAEARKANS